MGMRRNKSMKGDWPGKPVMAGNNNSKADPGKKKQPRQMRGKSGAGQAKRTDTAKMAKGYNLSK